MRFQMKSCGVCLRIFSLLVILICWSALTGCGDGRGARYTVAGSVLVDGVPLEYGTITFIPVTKSDGTRAGGGSLGADGKFSISSFSPNDGLYPGNYEVIISGIEPINNESQRWHAPQKYANAKTSGFKLEVKEDSPEILYELSWDGEKNSKPFVERF